MYTPRSGIYWPLNCLLIGHQATSIPDCHWFLYLVMKMKQQPFWDSQLSYNPLSPNFHGQFLCKLLVILLIYTVRLVERKKFHYIITGSPVSYKKKQFQSLKKVCNNILLSTPVQMASNGLRFSKVKRYENKNVIKARRIKRCISRK